MDFSTIRNLITRYVGRVRSEKQMREAGRREGEMEREKTT